MTTFTRDWLREIRADIDAALAPIAAKHNLTSLKNGKVRVRGAGYYACIGA